ncbi:MAG: DegT/DnrJ/eryc1/StrS aminotransferase [uncultured bacterium]|nr:MAG: DegT/DnrJ/eryc1/StrS aminotransferase [uncultured bacterium]
MRHLRAIGLSPNLEFADVGVALKAILRPWLYRVAPAEQKLHATLCSYFSSQNVWLFNSGRSALLIYLKSLQLPHNSVVAVQAFTCNAVINPIRWAGFLPNYIDIDPATYTMSPTDLQKKLTPKTKVLIIQHTFGQTADLAKLLDIARSHNLIIIEDCAHALGGKRNNQLLGTFGDAAIYSFGRDKVISSVYGGCLLVNKASQVGALQQQYDEVDYPTRFWIFQQLLHPIITYVALQTWYWFGFGRALFALAQRGHILSLAVSRGERQGIQPHYFPRRLPGGLAYLVQHQLAKLDRLNAQRRLIAKIYQQIFNPDIPLAESIYLRYTVRAKNRDKIFLELKKQDVILGDWYWQVVVPAAADLATHNYPLGSCPQAELAAQEVINLPTHIQINQKCAEMIARTVQSLRA